MARQKQIPGTERATGNAKIDEAAESYVEARDARMRASKKEIERKAALLALMQREGLREYEDLEASPPLLVLVVEEKTTVKVKALATEGDEGEVLE